MAFSAIRFKFLPAVIILFSNIYFYSTVHTSDAMFIIGGETRGPWASSSNGIYQLKNGKWTEFQNNNAKRVWHRAITIHDQVMIKTLIRP